MQKELNTTSHHSATHPAAERLGQLANSRLPGKRVGNLCCEDAVIVNWQALQATSNASVSCESCGLPGWARSHAYRVPGLVGRFHNICCVDCTLFGPGRCRCCGKRLDDRGGRRFCSEACARRSNATLFGNGERVLNYLRQSYPNVYQQIAGSVLPEAGMRGKAAAGVCLHCQEPLDGKRADALFCSARCKTRYRRSLARSQNTPISRNSGISESTIYDHRKRGIGPYHDGRGTTRLRASVVWAHTPVPTKQNCPLEGPAGVNRAKKGGEQ